MASEEARARAAQGGGVSEAKGLDQPRIGMNPLDGGDSAFFIG